MSKERFLTVMVPITDADAEQTVYANENALENAFPPSESNKDVVYKLSDGTYRRAVKNGQTYSYQIVKDREFPHLGEPLEIYDFTYDATRMGTAPTVSATVMWYAEIDGSGNDVTLEGLWTQECHVVFNGEKYYIKGIPTSSKSNEDARYKYDIEFVSERVILERVYLYDVVQPFVTEKPIVESSKFSFYGDIVELSKRINASLIRSGLATLTRKYVNYEDAYYEEVLPSTEIPYLSYEQWKLFNVSAYSLIGTVFNNGYELSVFKYEVYEPLMGDYNRYLMEYIYENTDGVYNLNGYQCKIGNDKYGNTSTSEEKLITFDDNTIHEALQQFHDTFELEYYITCEKDSNGNFTGNTFIIVGDCEHDFADWDDNADDFVRDGEGVPISTNPFDYGSTEALLSKEKTNTTDKIVTRITGVGSSENIPWYYPNPNPDGWIKPILKRKGIEVQEVSLDYPLDEGSSTQEYERYEKYLKNRIGNTIKKGCVRDVVFQGDYRSSDTISEQGTDYTIFTVTYEIDPTSLSTGPCMTLFLDYKPLLSKCTRITATLRGSNGSVFGSYDSDSTYSEPTNFQKMMMSRDRSFAQGLLSSLVYFLEISYTIPNSEMPSTVDYDYEGYFYPAVSRNLGQSAFSAIVSENFYQENGLQPFVKWEFLGGTTPIVYDAGYSTDGEYTGKAAPLPRRAGSKYKDISTGIIYKCETSKSPSSSSDFMDGSYCRNVFSADQKMELDEWIREFVNMSILVYADDGWYIGQNKINLEDYGLEILIPGGTSWGSDIYNYIEFQRVKWLTAQPNLMPEVYIKTDGERRFYDARNYYPLQDGTADTAIGEEQYGDKIRNPLYKENETDTDDKHYVFENKYIQKLPNEHIEMFDDVKPTIEGQTNEVDGVQIRIDVVESFEYDATDNNEIWDENEPDTIQGDYKHPYFFAKLRPLGFNIFDLATTEDMVLSMKNGNCGACNFKIGVDEATGKNPVQVWEYDVYDGADPNTANLVYNAGSLRRYVNLIGLYYDTPSGFVPVSDNMLIEGGGLNDYMTNMYDRYTYSEKSVKNGLVGGVKQDGKKHFEGDVVTNGRFIESQQDTSNNYVWVALMKDTESYGVIMPSAIPNYNDTVYNNYIEPKGIQYTNRATGEQSTLTEEQADKFVLTNIRLPQIYLRRAERKLSREIVKYMYEHNWQRFNFSIKFSRIYIANNPATDDDMNENSVLYVLFNGIVYRQYAKHYTYKMSHDAPLPETSVDMNEDLSVSRTMLQQWDRKLEKSVRSSLSHTVNVASQTRDLAQKHSIGKYEDLSSQISTSQYSITDIVNCEDGAQVNVQSDWNQTDSTADDFIKNKPQIIENAETIDNKVVSISSSSTDIEYPSAKAVYKAIDALPTPMVFKGTVGRDGTITTLPAADSSNIGFTYKVIDNISSPVTAKIGDTVISNGNVWTVIPSGDEPSGTVTSINSGDGLQTDQTNSGPITSSGTMSVKASTGITVNSNGVSVTDYNNIVAGAAAGLTALQSAPVTSVNGQTGAVTLTLGEQNVQSDWNQTNSSSDDFIKNKPTIPNAQVQADWEATSGISSILNRPSLTKGEGNGSIENGQLSYLKAIGNYSHAEGYYTVSYGNHSHSEGSGNKTKSSFTVSGSSNATTYTTNISHGLIVGDVLMYNNVYRKVTQIDGDTSFTLDSTLSETALSNINVDIINGVSSGNYSHSEGNKTHSTGNYSHSEGSSTVSKGDYSHAEGATTVSEGSSSHAEGRDSVAQANYSHAEGRSTSSQGLYSHSEGYKTVTTNSYEHAEGQYNLSNQASSSFGNSGNTLKSIGFGSSESNRKNAVEVMQNGDVYIKDIGGYTGTNPSTATRIQDCIALDTGVVHNTGDETVAGTKEFSSEISASGGVVLSSTTGNNRHDVQMINGAYYDDSVDGIGVLSLNDPDGSGNVIIRNVYNPIQNWDAANKAYVDAAIIDAASGGVTVDVGNTKIYYGTCATAAATTTKAVSCADFRQSDLVPGVMVLVKFQYKNTGAVASLKLNVQNTGEISIKKNYSTTGVTDLTAAGELGANSVVPFIYTGEYWLVAGLDYNTNTTYSAMTQSEIDAGTSTTGRIISPSVIVSNFVRKTGDETIAGEKTFSDDMHIAGDSLIFESVSYGTVNVGLSTKEDGIPSFVFSGDGQETTAVRLRGVHTPSLQGDAVNKKYVDDIVGDIESLLSEI